MKLEDTFGTIGQVSIELKDEHGNVKAKRHINNLVVQVGKDLIAARFAGVVGANGVSHIGLGSGTTAASLAQTALVTPITPRVATAQTVTANPASIVFTATFAGGVATGSISEAGLFTALTSGTMIARTTFAAIPKAANDVITVTWTLIFG
jgi:hypothetical protein